MEEQAGTENREASNAPEETSPQAASPEASPPVPQAPPMNGPARPPRSVEEITKEYAELASTTGMAYLQRAFHDRNLEHLADLGAQLQYELNYRNKLDEAASTAAIAAAEAKRKRKLERNSPADKVAPEAPVPEAK